MRPVDKDYAVEPCGAKLQASPEGAQTFVDAADGWKGTKGSAWDHGVLGKWSDEGLLGRTACS